MTNESCRRLDTYPTDPALAFPVASQGALLKLVVVTTLVVLASSPFSTANQFAATGSSSPATLIKSSISNPALVGTVTGKILSKHCGKT